MIPRRVLKPGPLGLGLQSRLIVHRHHAPLINAFKRRESTTTGEEKSGHIAAKPNESIIFFDNLFPLVISGLLQRSSAWRSELDLADVLKRFESSSLGLMDPLNQVKRAIPEELSAKVTDIIPRFKDGGAFVKFSHAGQVAPADIERDLRKTLAANPIKPWYNPWASVRVGLVKGVPWLEDLHRFPKTRLKVEFVPPTADAGEAVELSQETLYSLFRRYGVIGDIISQPFDSKAVPRYAYLDFPVMREAIMARNCMHGFVVTQALGGGKKGTKLRLSYEQRVKAHHIWDWVSSHPRIVIPLIAALLAAITVVVFDPVRQFFVKAHVQQSFKLKNNRVVKWFKRQTSDIISFGSKGEEAGLNAVWTHRKDIIDSVQTWLLETADTFIVVQGPRGSGKKELIVDQALKSRKDVLVIDCKPIIEARGESNVIRKLASAVGYRPVFSWANSLSSMIDLAVQGTTGVKASFSETFEAQLQKILQTTGAALKEVTLAHRSKGDKDASLNEDAYLEAHPEKRAVIVIDNFLHKSEEISIVYDKIAEWAAAMVQNNLAHVIFLTNDNSYSKSLSKSLPDRVFRQVALGDLSPDVAKQYVVSHLEGLDREDIAKNTDDGESEDSKQAPKTEVQRRADLKELDGCIGTLGGRLTDLEFLARRLKSGQSPQRAVAEIVEQSSSEIMKMFLLKTNIDSGRKWSTEQAWYLIREIAEKESLRYNEVLLSNTFASSTTSSAADGEAALEDLANAELITVKSHRGRPMAIRAGKPVYQAAFATLRDDPVLRAKMDIALLTELAKVEAANISKAENELSLLGSLPKTPAQTTERVNYLLAKLQGSQQKIASFDAEMATLKNVLSHEA